MFERSLSHRLRTAARQTFRAAAVSWASIGLIIGSAQPVVADDAPQRANDTGYGMALYQYHQGNFFQALTRLNVANAAGGVAGHGDHPLLVEGGLMLAYGMTREAQRLFQTLLDESNVSAEARNQAWFYLGKVFWLEKDRQASLDALDRVDGDLLEDTDVELYHEWLYLRGQWLIASPDNTLAELAPALDDLLDELPDESPWRWYLNYNYAVRLLSEDNAEAAIAELSLVIDQARLEDDWPEADKAELQSLEQQARLSLGRLYLQQNDYPQAMSVLDDMPLDGLLSDQALFDYAVAASREGQYGRALQALDTLQGRPLFTPWLQQVPYARAFTIEQMENPEAALAAYRRAAEHYLDQDRQLADQQSALSEQTLIDALAFVREGAEAAEPDAIQPQLGEEAMLTDAYGRIQVRPQDFSLARLLAGETFQLALRDHHELYRLDDSLDQWREQLASFELMLDTRQTRREARVRETRQALAAMKVDEWAERQAAYRRQIEAASSEQDAAFFMTTEQRELEQQLDRVEATLAKLPDDESTREQRQNYQRMRAYFDWQVADDYGVNRWAAVRQLRELDDAMETFVSQRARMEAEMASDARLEDFATRIAARRSELNRLDAGLDQALAQTRQSLMAQVRSELQSQRQVIANYLRASRHAQARLADRLFLESRETALPEPESGTDATMTDGEISNDPS